MSFTVVRAFAAVSWQGGPVSGLRRYGVPPGGALDQESLALANSLLGRPWGDAALEVTGGSIEVRIDGPCRLVVVGAPVSVLGREGSFLLNCDEGEHLSIQLGNRGYTYYLASSPQTTSGGAIVRLAEPPSSIEPSLLRFVRGPQGTLLRESLGVRTVTNQISRMGIRLSTGEGHSIELPSEPACVGAVQITPDGTPIILGPDGPTIGGYPKVAVVCAADLDKLGQLRPGSEVTFEEVTLEQARVLRIEKHRALKKRLAELRLNLTLG